MSSTAFDYELERPKVEGALRTQFPQDTIATRQGYLGRVQVTLVSSRLNGMTEAEKQDFVWGILRDRLGEDSQVVSIVTPYGTDEL